MAFSDNYFSSNKKLILNDYASICEKVMYVTPLYCATKPTQEIEDDPDKEGQRYFNLMLKFSGESITKNVWISAITDEGTHLFIKTKILIEPLNGGEQQVLLQQTLYFNHNKKLLSMY